jgi:hypothetical protein
MKDGGSPSRLSPNKVEKSLGAKDVNEYIYNKTLEKNIDRKEMFSDLIQK